MDMENKKYGFVLGSNSALSVAEIFSVLELVGNFEVVALSEEILIIKCPPLEENLIDRLGGTIKIIEIFSEIDINNYKPDIAVQKFKDLISNLAYENQNKFHFGISIYRLDATESEVGRLFKSLKNICINLKKSLKTENIGLAFLNIKDRYLSSASVIKNKLADEDGLEGVLVLSNSNIYFGKTICVQNIDLYTELDVERPVRDIVSGTIPPKLAKMMINLAAQYPDAYLLDPFCGSGTFLQEMILLGFKNITGSDISEKAVNDTKTNLNWLKEKFALPNAEYEIYQSDIIDLEKLLKPESIDAVISEGYLGPAFKGPIVNYNLNKLISELTGFYKKVFEKLAKLLKKDGVIVFALPAFRTENKVLTLPITEDLKNLGLKIVNQLEGRESFFEKLITERKTIIYSRPDQFVLREIVVLNKLKG